MTDEEVGLYQQLCGVVERRCADSEFLQQEELLQVLNSESPFELVGSMKDGKPLPGLPQSIGQQKLLKSAGNAFLCVCFLAHTATKVRFFGGITKKAAKKTSVK